LKFLKNAKFFPKGPRKRAKMAQKVMEMGIFLPKMPKNALCSSAIISATPIDRVNPIGFLEN
jgi:hypothetical protein